MGMLRSVAKRPVDDICGRNEATVYALFAHGNLLKVNLLLLPPEHRLFEVYDGMKASLVKKYGPPENSYAFFE